MFITDRFIFLHLPKTGGTFVHKVLRDLYCPSRTGQKIHSARREYGIRLPLFRYRYFEEKKHRIRRLTPQQFQHLPVLICVRNPYDWYVSGFKFDWWRQHPARWYVDVEAVEKAFGKLENFGFQQFVRSTIRYGRWANTGRAGKVDVGGHSAEWLRYVSADIASLENCPNRDQLMCLSRKQSQDVSAIHMEDLNQGLFDFLAGQGFAPESIQHILTMKKIYPGSVKREQNDSWRDHYDDALMQEVRDHEWLLFEFYPQYDIQVGDLHAV